MSNKYEQLEKLDELRRKGAITEEEYQREKYKILNNNISQGYANAQSTGLGANENTYLMFMHLSQLAGILTAGLGFMIPLIMWLINKDTSRKVDWHGKNIFNFMISWFIYIVALCVLIFVFFVLVLTIPFAFVGMIVLIVVAVLELIFIIVATIKAGNGEYWTYPMSIPFFYVPLEAKIKH